MTSVNVPLCSYSFVSQCLLFRFWKAYLSSLTLLLVVFIVVADVGSETKLRERNTWLLTLRSGREEKRQLLRTVITEERMKARTINENKIPLLVCSLYFPSHIIWEYHHLHDHLLHENVILSLPPFDLFLVYPNVATHSVFFLLLSHSFSPFP